MKFTVKFRYLKVWGRKRERFLFLFRKALIKYYDDYLLKYILILQQEVMAIVFILTFSIVTTFVPTPQFRYYYHHDCHLYPHY